MARDVNLLHPRIHGICLEHQRRCKNVGIDFIVTQTLRTAADQAEIYAKGRTAPGNIVTYCRYPDSPHCWGCAYDIAILVKGKVVWGERDDLYRRAAAIGKELGLTWGGDFKRLYDSPHFEDPEFVKGKSVKWLKQTYGTPQKFIATWKGQPAIPAYDFDVSVNAGGVILPGIGFVVDGRTMVPIREIGEAMGVKIGYNATMRVPTSGGKDVTIGGLVINGTTYYPARQLGEVLDVEVSWDATSRTVKYSKKN